MADAANSRTALRSASAQVRQLFASPALPGPSEREGLDLRQILSALYRRKAIILGCFLLGIAVAEIVVNQFTPRYSAEAAVMLETRKFQILNFQSVMSGMQNDFAAVADEVALLNGPTIASKAAARLHLEREPEFNPALRPAPAFDPIGWVRHVISLPFSVSLHFFEKAPPESKSDEPVRPETPDATPMGYALMGHVSAANDGQSYIISIRAQSENPRLAADIANAYVDAYLTDQLDAKYEATARASEWLNSHLADLRKKVEDSEKAVALFQQQNNLAQTKGATLTDQQVSELNSQLIIASADVAQQQSDLQALQATLRTPGAIETSALVLKAAPIVEKLREQEADLEKQEADLSTRYRPEHPTMVNLRAQIADLKNKIGVEARNAMQSLSSTLAAARARVAALKDALAKAQQSNGLENTAAVELRELQREADANKALYENFLNRFKQTSAEQDIQQADARRIATALPPGGPSYPNKPLFVEFAAMLSLGFGILLAFVLEWIDNGFRSTDQLEHLAGIGTLGLIPATPGGVVPQDLILDEPVSQYSESIRSVRAALRYSDIDNPPKIVLVTSSIPSEGKTILSTSLARSVARSGGKALLIDCDLRRPGVSKLLNATQGPTLLDLFDGTGSADSVIQVDRTSAMHYVAAKTGTSNPQDLLGSQHMRGFLEQMRSRYDLIVLDSPPVLAVSDAVILSHIADKTIFVVRWETTPRAIALGALKALRTNGGAVAGAVLTRVNIKKHASYGYGDSAYHYHNYSEYYSQPS
jgi:capsular exopolysaccharide synthesis family protein